MSIPQQPEIARSRRSEVTAEVASKVKAGTSLPEGDTATGPIPEENLPGHHPPVEQDKPQGPPPEPGVRAPKPKARTKARAKKRDDDTPAQPRRFPFAVAPGIAPLARMVGISSEKAAVEVADEQLRVRFGPWSVETPLANVEGASEALVPFGWPTFVTNRGGAVRIRFKDAVPGALPFGLLPGKSLTVTVEDADGLLEALT
jgi:hypothetical protein